MTGIGIQLSINAIKCTVFLKEKLHISYIFYETNYKILSEYRDYCVSKVTVIQH